MKIIGKPKTKKKARKTIQKTSMFSLHVIRSLFNQNVDPGDYRFYEILLFILKKKSQASSEEEMGRPFLTHI